MLYEKGKAPIPCVDKAKSSFCTNGSSKCKSPIPLVKYAFIKLCCGTCYAIDPNFLPKKV
ncbi:unnamed protein product [Meloidogyne enterolobii]|uniref:Uncharacterized protein n=3 Tax=Meloidogyne enterolobii TaxID=390850 RepID=A0A6V7U2B0_MELEN|nr:unnamed protein product [Meloidogyne enterolobii]CAD2183641.1 unnamed protein product [Meloidogyne enterolobii]